MEIDPYVRQSIDKLIELSKKQIELLEQILRVFRKYDDEYLAEIESGDAKPG